MAKCRKKVRHRLIFELPGEGSSSLNASINDWDNPKKRLVRWGSLSPRIPTEVVQAEQVKGALGYDIEVPYDPEIASVTSNYRVTIETLGNKILELRGPAANRDGASQWIDFVAVEETD